MFLPLHQNTCPAQISASLSEEVLNVSKKGGAGGRHRSTVNLSGKGVDAEGVGHAFKAMAKRNASFKVRKRALCSNPFRRHRRGRGVGRAASHALSTLPRHPLTPPSCVMRHVPTTYTPCSSSSQVMKGVKEQGGFMVRHDADGGGGPDGHSPSAHSRLSGTVVKGARGRGVLP